MAVKSREINAEIRPSYAQKYPREARFGYFSRRASRIFRVFFGARSPLRVFFKARLAYFSRIFRRKIPEKPEKPEKPAEKR
jgi:hypothetical protein